MKTFKIRDDENCAFYNEKDLSGYPGNTQALFWIENEDFDERCGIYLTKEDCKTLAQWLLDSGVLDD